MPDKPYVHTTSPSVSRVAIATRPVTTPAPVPTSTTGGITTRQTSEEIARKPIEKETVETTTEVDLDKYVKLDTGEYIDKTEYDKLSDEDKARVKASGIEGLSKYHKEQKAKFEADNIQLKDDKWINREYYSNLSPGLQKAIVKLGSERFNQLLDNAEKSGLASDYQAIEREMPEYWDELNKDRVFIPGSRLWRNWRPTYRTDVALMNPYAWWGAEEPKAGFIDKKVFDSLEPSQVRELYDRGIDNFSLWLQNPSTWTPEPYEQMQTMGFYDFVVLTPSGTAIVSHDSKGIASFSPISINAIGAIAAPVEKKESGEEYITRGGMEFTKSDWQALPIDGQNAAREGSKEYGEWIRTSFVKIPNPETKQSDLVRQDYFNNLDAESKKILLSSGIKVLETKQQEAIKALEPYKTMISTSYMDEPVPDIARYLREDSKASVSNLKILGYNDKTIKELQEYNELPWVKTTPLENFIKRVQVETKGEFGNNILTSQGAANKLANKYPSLFAEYNRIGQKYEVESGKAEEKAPVSMNQFVADFMTARGEINPRAPFDIIGRVTEPFTASQQALSIMGVQEYTRLYGKSARISEAGIETGALTFGSAVKGLSPGYKVTTEDWISSAFQTGLLASGGLSSLIGKASPFAAKLVSSGIHVGAVGYFGKETAVNWDKMNAPQKILSAGMNALILYSGMSILKSAIPLVDKRITPAKFEASVNKSTSKLKDKIAAATTPKIRPALDKVVKAVELQDTGALYQAGVELRAVAPKIPNADARVAINDLAKTITEHPAEIIREATPPLPEPVKVVRKFRDMTAPEFESIAEKGRVNPYADELADIKAVASGEKPAALFNPEHPDLLSRAISERLVVAKVPRIEKGKFSYLAFRPDGKKILDIYKEFAARYELGTASTDAEISKYLTDATYHIELGTILGYSEKDIAAFLNTTARRAGMGSGYELVKKFHRQAETLSEHIVEKKIGTPEYYGLTPEAENLISQMEGGTLSQTSIREIRKIVRANDIDPTGMSTRKMVKALIEKRDNYIQPAIATVTTSQFKIGDIVELPDGNTGIIKAIEKKFATVSYLQPEGGLGLDTIQIRALKSYKPIVEPKEGFDWKADDAPQKTKLDSFKGRTEIEFAGEATLTQTELIVKKGFTEAYVNGTKILPGATVPVNYGDYVRIGNTGIKFMPKEVSPEALIKAADEFDNAMARKSLSDKVMSIAVPSLATGGVIKTWLDAKDEEKQSTAILGAFMLSMLLTGAKKIPKDTVNVSKLPKPIRSTVTILTRMEKIALPPPKQVAEVLKLARESGEYYKTYQRTMSDLKSASPGSSNYSKVTNSAQKAINNMAKTDRQLFDKLSVIGEITTDELRQIEVNSRITGLKQGILDINKAIKQIDDAWKDVERLEKLPKIKGLDIAHIKALGRLETAKNNLERVTSKWGETIQKPRYDISSKLNNQRVINALENELYNAEFRLNRTRAEYKKPTWQSESKLNELSEEITDINTEIAGYRGQLEEFRGMVKRGEDLPAEITIKYRLVPEAIKPTDWDKGGIPPKSTTPKATYEIKKRIGIDPKTGRLVTSEERVAKPAKKQVMEKIEVKRTLFDIKEEEKVEVKKTLPKEETKVPKVKESRGTVEKPAVSKTVSMREVTRIEPMEVDKIVRDTVTDVRKITREAPNSNYITSVRQIVQDAINEYNELLALGMTATQTSTKLRSYVATKLKTATQVMISPALEDQPRAMEQTATQTKTATRTAVATATKIATQTELQTKIQPVTKTIVRIITRTATKLTTKLPTKIPTPKKPPPPPPFIIIHQKAGNVKLSKEQVDGAIAWKQGVMYKMIYEPYGKKDIVNTPYPIEGVKYYDGVGSAAKSAVVKLGNLPETIHRDMGIMDITIPKTPKGKKPDLRFKLDLKQKTNVTPTVSRVR